MEYALKLLHRLGATTTPRVYNTWIQHVFPPMPTHPTLLGRWRNVNRGKVDSDTCDPAYDRPEGQVRDKDVKRITIS